MNFEDRTEISGTRKTDDGYVVTEAFAVRTGIQLYRGTEIGLIDADVVRVWRPEDEVKAPESIKTFSHAPVTIGHPEKPVTADSWRDVAVGEVSTEAEWVDGKIRLPLILKDAAAIKVVEGGTRELSAGYTAFIDHTSGVTPEGEPYDAIQRDIRINHLALVPSGRAGPEFRIGDGAKGWGTAPVTTADRKEGEMPETLRKIMVDGLTVETTDAGVAAIEKLQAQIADMEKKAKGEEDDFKAKMAEKDKHLATKDAEIDDLKGKVLDAAALDKRVADRSSLIASARKIASDLKMDGLSDEDIRTAVVKQALGDAAVADKSKDYIEARFDTLVEKRGSKISAFDQDIKPQSRVVSDWGGALKSANVARKEG